MARLERFDPVTDGAAKDAISMLTGISAITWLAQQHSTRLWDLC
jgi:hypothetical protein